jgi:hypothetical protein
VALINDSLFINHKKTRKSHRGGLVISSGDQNSDGVGSFFFLSFCSEMMTGASRFPVPLDKKERV